MRRNRHAVGRRSRHTIDQRGSVTGQFAVCVCNDDYPASLELRKLYAVVDDEFAEKHALLRVIDESGDDYLYPTTYFVRVALPKTIEKTLRSIA